MTAGENSTILYRPDEDYWPESWVKRLAMDAIIIGFVSGVAVGVLGMLFMWRPWNA